ncbi:MAG TPA: helix-turn-helix transcriptional regulator [Ktedonobacteraceae bacterium]|nr:helix-turn-helix transcriptional regulator [Ktedonobacteraceae bacterium]
MGRAQLSTTTGKERMQLIAARHACHFSQDEVAAQLGVSKVTVHRWEKAGDVPQPLHLRNLCGLFGKSAHELGFPEPPPEQIEDASVTQTSTGSYHEAEGEENALAAFRQQHLTSRLMAQVWNWLPGDARYQKLQWIILSELEGNAMSNDISRRDALRFLALVPMDMLGLSPFGAVFKRPFSYEDILKHCAAGVVACWKLRKEKELAFADLSVSAYIPTLQEMLKTAIPVQRKAAAELLAQCFLLKAPLAWHLATVSSSVGYAQQAENYSIIADNLLLQIVALKMQAAALYYANQWGEALRTTEKAKCLLEGRDSRDRQKHASVAQSTTEPIPPLAQSYLYAGLAIYQASSGYKQEALLSLQKAHSAFFAQTETPPIWIDHSLGNLLLHDGSTHLHLGLYKEALDSFGQIETQYARNGQHMSCLIEATFEQVMTETSRDDQPRSMDRCIDLWLQGINGAKELRSQQRFTEAINAYTAMRAAWPGEKRVKELREQLVR